MQYDDDYDQQNPNANDDVPQQVAEFEPITKTTKKLSKKEVRSIIIFCSVLYIYQFTDNFIIIRKKMKNESNAKGKKMRKRHVELKRKNVKRVKVEQNSIMNLMRIDHQTEKHKYVSFC